MDSRYSPAPEGWLQHLALCATCRERGVDVHGWHAGTAAPETPGPYERLFTDGPAVHLWDGAVWRRREDGPPHWRQVGDYPCWRVTPSPA